MDTSLVVGEPIDFVALANVAFDSIASDPRAELVCQARKDQVRAWQSVHRIDMGSLRDRGSPWASDAEKLAEAHALAHADSDDVDRFP